jgi:type VI secretion system protein ImpM
MGMFRPAVAGFFGKLPARGDFLRAQLPEAVVEALDQWCRECLQASRAALGEGWTEAWMSAPVWRFLLAPGACGAMAVLGVWLPSMDKAGRHYPFLLCALSETEAGLREGGGWLALAETQGLAGVVEDKPHEAIAAALQTETEPLALSGAGWWTEGSPLVQPRQIAISVLPPPEVYAGAMLRDVTPGEPG